MERLLADAQKLTGVKYDISNLGDVYEAIHVIQGELGLTDVAALEAQTTLTGSFNAMKASWTNVMAAMTTGEGLDVAVQNLSTTAGSFINVAMQMFSEFVTQVPTLVSGIGEAVVANSPQLIASSVEMIGQLAIGFLEGIPTFIENVPTFFSEVSASFSEIDWASIGGSIIEGIKSGVVAAASSLWSAVSEAASGAINWVKEKLRINSPSKVFADEVGRWIPEGMAVGIKGNLTPVKTSVDAMAATASAELRRAASPSVGFNQAVSQTPRLGQNVPQQPQKIVIEFTGSLAQLGRVLQPHIKAEEQRRGPQYVR